MKDFPIVKGILNRKDKVSKKEEALIRKQAREIAVNNRAAFKLPYPENMIKFTPAVFFLQSGERGRIFSEEYQKYLL